MSKKHPAVFTDNFIPLFAKLLTNSKKVLDPFAGTGKLAEIKKYGYKGVVCCNELEPEWANSGLYDVDEWVVGDARDLSWAKNVDAICTSPTYGNRMADHHNAKDGSRRITYKHYLGRDLTDGNSGSMQWGAKYRRLHSDAWQACFSVLPNNGLMIVNISNHIRCGQEIDVVLWHQYALEFAGFDFVEKIAVATPRMKFGTNRQVRVANEFVLVYKKIDKGCQQP